MQVYKGLDLMTNKVTENEKEGIAHHLMDFVSPVVERKSDGSMIQGEYSVPEFQRDALRVVPFNLSEP
jgi:tRNA A37 N6-isopentenylltransferase MiaA